jgi:4'-phosphopantetheinyl transferase
VAVLYAFSACSELGVDIELVQPELAGGGLAERFFSPREVRTLRALPEKDQTHAFLACWTRKEAFLKARGDGLTLALDSFDVTLAPDEPAALLRTGWSPVEHSRWRVVDLSDIERHQVAALAAPATGWHCVCRDIDITTIDFN